MYKRKIEHRQSLLESRYTMENIVARSEAMQKVLLMVQRLASSTLAVCIQGESGTGKELIARSLHFNSERGKGPFISENCGALTETLLESELFGHAKGAFTGALQDHKGYFETCGPHGSVLLDEITETKPAPLRTYAYTCAVHAGPPGDNEIACCSLNGDHARVEETER